MINKKELLLNAINLRDLWKKARPTRHIQCLMFVFDDRAATESAVCAATVDDAQIIAVCRGILKKLGKDPDSVILNPHDYN